MLTSQPRTGDTKPVVLIGLCIVAAVVLAFWRPWVPPATPCDDSVFKAKRQEALDLQRDEKWCEAQIAWEEVLRQIPEASSCEPQRDEAETNLRIARGRCESISTGVDTFSLPTDPKERKQPTPEIVPKEQLFAAYPQGRHVQSLGFFNITGEGENTRWILHGKNFFAYQYRVVAETEVLNNTGTRLDCDLHFKDVHQIRAVSKRILKLEFPNSPVLQAVWGQVDVELRTVPGYLIVKRVAEVLDPDLEQTLTLLSDTFFPADKNDEIALLVDAFNGLHIRVEYISGLGVTRIDVLDGRKFDPSDLERLGYNLGIVMDYFVGTVADAEVGVERELRVEDLVGMLVLGYDISPRGTLRFAKVAGNSDGEVELEVRGGQIDVKGRVGGTKRTGTFNPISGKITYLPAQRLISRATMEWEAGIDWVPDDHLLFGTTGDVNVKMTSYYEAKRIDTPATKKDGKP